MEGSELKDILKELKMKQIDLIKLIEQLSGQKIGNVTVNRWVKGHRKVPAVAAAFINLLRWERDNA